MAAMRAAAVAAAERRTDDADIRGMRYLTIVLVPIVLASSVNALLTNQYRSFWSPVWCVFREECSCVNFQIQFLFLSRHYQQTDVSLHFDCYY